MGRFSHPERAQRRSIRDLVYAMNMRAAEAIVSNAPKPMKIFPISEVSSEVELSSLLAATSGAGVAGASAAAIVMTGAGGGALSCSVRSTSLS